MPRDARREAGHRSLPDHRPGSSVPTARKSEIGRPGEIVKPTHGESIRSTGKPSHHKSSHRDSSSHHRSSEHHTKSTPRSQSDKADSNKPKHKESHTKGSHSAGKSKNSNGGEPGHNKNLHAGESGHKTRSHDKSNQTRSSRDQKLRERVKAHDAPPIQQMSERRREKLPAPPARPPSPGPSPAAKSTSSTSGESDPGRLSPNTVTRYGLTPGLVSVIERIMRDRGDMGARTEARETDEEMEPAAEEVGTVVPPKLALEIDGVRVKYEVGDDGNPVGPPIPMWDQEEEDQDEEEEEEGEEEEEEGEEEEEEEEDELDPSDEEPEVIVISDDDEPAPKRPRVNTNPRNTNPRGGPPARRGRPPGPAPRPMVPGGTRIRRSGAWKRWTGQELVLLHTAALTDASHRFEGAVPGRTARQCESTWRNTICPAIVKMLQERGA